MGPKFHDFFSTGAEPAEPAEINDQSGARGSGLGARARARADSLRELILLMKYIYVKRRLCGTTKSLPTMDQKSRFQNA